MRTLIMHVVGTAAVTGTLTLLGLAGAGAAVVPASAARPTHPVTAYVVNFNNGSLPSGRRARYPPGQRSWFPPLTFGPGATPGQVIG